MNHHTSRLKAGDKAPDFSVVNEQGEVMGLDDFKGKKLVLFFYPEDNTPTCTVEACNLRDHYAGLKKKGFEVIGISANHERSHLKFIEKHQLPFHLLADTEMKMIRDYDVWGKKTVFGKTYKGLVRTTFVVDEKGRIAKVIRDVQAKDHARQILEELPEPEMKKS